MGTCKGGYERTTNPEQGSWETGFEELGLGWLLYGKKNHVGEILCEQEKVIPNIAGT